MSEQSNGSRLPPPAFPPGAAERRHVVPRGPDPEVDAGDIAGDPFITPDDPIPPRTDPIGAAFISPDDPLPARAIETGRDERHDVILEAGEEGIVVGMDMDDGLDRDEVVSGGDPHVMEVLSAVGKLAAGLRQRGEAALHVSPEMSRFEATLRGYCVGYLAGRRAEAPSIPIVEDPLPTDG